MRRPSKYFNDAASFQSIAFCKSTAGTPVFHRANRLDKISSIGRAASEIKFNLTVELKADRSRVSLDARREIVAVVASLSEGRH